MSRRKKPGPKRSRGRPPISKTAKIRDRDAKSERRKFLKEMGLVEIHCFVNAEQREFILSSSRETVAKVELEAAIASDDQLTILLAEQKLELVRTQLNKARSDRERQLARLEAEKVASQNSRDKMLVGMERMRKAREAELDHSVTLPDNITPIGQDTPALAPDMARTMHENDIKKMLAGAGAIGVMR